MVTKKQIKKYSIPLKLTVFSNIALLFLRERSSSCGSKSYGFPADFIQTYCRCSEHIFPIDVLGLGVDLAYHFVIWFAVLYLWQDAKETWAMVSRKQNMEGF